MNGLTAVLSPTTLFITTQLDDIQLQELELTVRNTSGADLVLSVTDALRVDFVIDQSGTSTGALLLANSAGNAFDTVEAAEAGGTAWQIQSVSIQPDWCSFLMAPYSQVTLAADESIAFNFTNIAVDMLEGTSTVYVTLLDGNAGTSTPLTPSPTVTKVMPPAQIVSFTANGLPYDVQLSPPSNQVQIEWSTIAANCSLVWDQTETTVVTYEGETIESPWGPVTTPPTPAVPLQTQNTPVTAVVFQTTQFTLTAEGGGSPVVSQLVVDPSEALLTAFSGPSTFSPFKQFQLTWQLFDNMGAALVWSDSVNQTVAVSTTADGQSPYTSGTALSVNTVYVTVTVPTGASPEPVDFALNLTAESPPLPSSVQLATQLHLLVGVAPVTISSFTAGPVQVVDTANGQQAVTLAWTAQNATGFILTGYDTDIDTGNLIIGPLQYDSNQLTTQLDLPLTVGSIKFSLTAGGYDAPTTPSSVEVLPNQIALVTNVTASTPQITGPGQQTVTLNWQFQYPTHVMILASYPGGSSSTPVPDASATSWPVTLPDITAGTVTFTVYGEGYPPPGDWDNSIYLEAPPITPIAVSGVVLGPPSKQVPLDTQLTLTWSAIAATGFTLELGEPQDVVSLPASRTTYPVIVSADTTYTITALGYTGGGPNPTASVPFTVPKHLKEDFIEKTGRIQEKVQPGLSPGSGGTPGAELPSGSQQPFIGSDERPDVGAHLRDNDPSA
jgi:hypothetical protein